MRRSLDYLACVLVSFSTCATQFQLPVVGKKFLFGNISAQQQAEYLN